MICNRDFKENKVLDACMLPIGKNITEVSKDV